MAESEMREHAALIAGRASPIRRFAGSLRLPVAV